MKSLQLLCSAVFLLAFVNAFSDKTDETENVTRVKCVELFGKCLVEITVKSDLVKQAIQLNRVKRNIMNSGKCAQGQVWYKYKCWDCKEALVEQQEDIETENNVQSSTLLVKIKRSIVNYGQCPEGSVKLKVLGQPRCVTCKEYFELTGNDC